MLTGDIPLAVLCRMTSEELASAEVKEHKAEIARKALLVSVVDGGGWSVCLVGMCV